MKRLVIAKLLAVALLAPTTIAIGDTANQDQCWNLLKSHQEQCAALPANVQDASCFIGALDSHGACLEIQLASASRLNSKPFMSGVAVFDPGNQSLPAAIKQTFENPGPAGTYLLTLLNNSGNPAQKLSHVRVTINSAVVFDDTNFSQAVAKEVSVSLNGSTNTVLIQTDGKTAGVVTAWLTNGRIASVDDLE